MIKLNKTAIALGLTAALWSSTAMAIDLGETLSSVTETVNEVTGTVTETVESVTGIESSVTTSSGGGSLLGVEASVSGIVDAEVNVGGSGGLLGVDVNVGGGGNGNHGGNGTNGTNGTNGRNSIIGNNGNNRNNGAIIRSGGSGSGGFVATATCSGTNPNQLVNLFESTRIRNWNRATSIQLVPVPVCSAVRKELAGWLATNQDFHRMVGAVASDALINAALSRTKYQPGNVIGVQSTGSTLTVYVF